MLRNITGSCRSKKRPASPRLREVRQNDEGRKETRINIRSPEPPNQKESSEVQQWIDTHSTPKKETQSCTRLKSCARSHHTLLKIIVVTSIMLLLNLALPISSNLKKRRRMAGWRPSPRTGSRKTDSGLWEDNPSTKKCMGCSQTVKGFLCWSGWHHCRRCGSARCSKCVPPRNGRRVCFNLAKCNRAMENIKNAHKAIKRHGASSKSTEWEYKHTQSLGYGMPITSNCPRCKIKYSEKNDTLAKDCETCRRVCCKKCYNGGCSDKKICILFSKFIQWLEKEETAETRTLLIKNNGDGIEYRTKQGDGESSTIMPTTHITAKQLETYFSPEAAEKRRKKKTRAEDKARKSRKEAEENEKEEAARTRRKTLASERLAEAKEQEKKKAERMRFEEMERQKEETRRKEAAIRIAEAKACFQAAEKRRQEEDTRLRAEEAAKHRRKVERREQKAEEERQAAKQRQAAEEEHKNINNVVLTYNAITGWTQKQVDLPTLNKKQICSQCHQTFNETFRCNQCPMLCCHRRRECDTETLTDDSCMQFEGINKCKNSNRCAILADLFKKSRFRALEEDGLAKGTMVAFTMSDCQAKKEFIEDIEDTVTAYLPTSCQKSGKLTSQIKECIKRSLRGR